MVFTSVYTWVAEKYESDYHYYLIMSCTTNLIRDPKRFVIFSWRKMHMLSYTDVPHADIFSLFMILEQMFRLFLFCTVHTAYSN